MLDVEQATRIASEETDYPILRVNSDAIAICVLLRRRDDRPHRNILEFADPLQSITHDTVWFASINGRGFHGGLLDELRKFYA